MRKNIIAAAIMTIIAALTCWWLSRLTPLPAAPDSDLVSFGDDARLVGQLTEPTTGKAIIHDANSNTPKEQKVLILPGTWLVPESVIHMAEEKEKQ